MGLGEGLGEEVGDGLGEADPPPPPPPPDVGVTDTADDSTPSPTSLTATSLMEYVVPLVRPEIVTGLVESAGVRATRLWLAILYL